MTSASEDQRDRWVAVPDVAVGIEGVTDLLVVMDEDGRIAYANRFATTFLGWHIDDVIGRPITDFMHPDDIERAFEVVTRIADDSLGVALTPAEYRLRRSDGTWCPVEINGASAEGPRHRTGTMLLIGRYSGDHDLQNRMLERLTSGAPIAEAVELVPQFGAWRHPQDHYAVIFTDVDGTPRATGSPVAVAMAAIDRGRSPWCIAAADGVERKWATADLPPALRAAASAEGFSECWVVPVADARWDDHAVVVAWTRTDGPSVAVHRYSMERMQRAMEVILQWAKQLADLEWAATHDPLTSAVNRNEFFAALDGALSSDGGLVGVLYIDIDGFKSVNDSYGHTTGDAVLVVLAERLLAASADGNVVARLGGDEFALLCPALATVADASATAARLLEGMAAPFIAANHELVIGVSVGVAVGRAGRVAPDELIERADRALYAAKSAGRGRWHLSEVTAS